MKEAKPWQAVAAATVPFSKIHGIGNDFIVVDELRKEHVSERDKPFFARRYCKRRVAVGADGILFLCKPKSREADFRMRIFNPDGSEAETCVNGLRCAAFERFLLGKRRKSRHKIETAQGMVEAKVADAKKDNATVELQLLGLRSFKGKFYLSVSGKSFEYYSVDVGNPHAVVFLKGNVQNFPVEEIGHAFEWHKAFQPQRTNTEFVNVLSPRKVRMRVHERGACETAACGSGSVAAVVAGINAGVLQSREWVSVEQPGGVLEVKLNQKAFLRGAVQKVFSGQLRW